VARRPNPTLYERRITLDYKRFSIWHTSCSVSVRSFAKELMMSAQENQVALPLRSHTIFGACEAIGEDFGFNPVLLRVPFAATVLWSPMWAIGGYLALCAVVLLSRLVFPNARSPQSAVEVSHAPLSTEVDGAERQLPLAA